MGNTPVHSRENLRLVCTNPIRAIGLLACGIGILTSASNNTREKTQVVNLAVSCIVVCMNDYY